jgi:hypothetical protein
VIFPVAVTLNLFLALEFVFTFGILHAFYITPLRRSRSAGTLGGPLQAMVSLNEGRKDNGFGPSGKSNFQKLLDVTTTASMFNLILQIYAQIEQSHVDPVQELSEPLYSI